MDINSTIIIGRLVRDVEVSYTTTGTAIGKFTLAVNHMKKEEVSFIDVKVFGKLAENIKEFLTKGKQVSVDGFLKQERWESNGQKYSRVGIIANNVQLLGGRSESAGQSAPQDGYDYN